MRVMALVAAYNEERFIADCIENFIRQGVEVYLIDNGSTDKTISMAERYRNHGLVDIETLPRDGIIRWRQILKRKEQLAATLDADWFIHADPDEIRLPPLSRATLKEALEQVDAEGYNAVNFWEYCFIPTQESPDHDHADFQKTMRWYYSLLPFFPYRLNAWKRQADRVDLAGDGGHVVRFPGLRMYPESFRMLHYLFLSIPHAIRKYGGRVYDRDEVEQGWHIWRANFREQFVTLPKRSELRTWTCDRDLDPPNIRTREWLDPYGRIDSLPPGELSQDVELKRRYDAMQAWSRELLQVIAARDRELAAVKNSPAVRLLLWMRRLGRGSRGSR